MAGSAVVRNLKLTHRLHGCSRVLATLDPATYGARKRVRRCRSVRWTLAAGTSGPAAPGPGPAPVVPVAGPTVSHRQPATSGSADRSSWPARSGDAQRSSARSPAAVWRAPARGACSARPSSCSSRQARYAPGDSGHAGDVGLGRRAPRAGPARGRVCGLAMAGRFPGFLPHDGSVALDRWSGAIRLGDSAGAGVMACSGVPPLRRRVDV